MASRARIYGRGVDNLWWLRHASSTTHFIYAFLVFVAIRRLSCAISMQIWFCFVLMIKPRRHTMGLNIIFTGCITFSLRWIWRASPSEPRFVLFSPVLFYVTWGSLCWNGPVAYRQELICLKKPFSKSCPVLSALVGRLKESVQPQRVFGCGSSSACPDLCVSPLCGPQIRAELTINLDEKQEERTFHIFIKPLAGRSILIWINDEDSVKNVKYMIRH